jgi:hypothetical protein
MATYITLLKYTEQGLRTIKESPSPLEKAKHTAPSESTITRSFGCTATPPQPIGSCQPTMHARLDPRGRENEDVLDTRREVTLVRPADQLRPRTERTDDLGCRGKKRRDAHVREDTPPEVSHTSDERARGRSMACQLIRRSGSDPHPALAPEKSVRQVTALEGAS